MPADYEPNEDSRFVWSYEANCENLMRPLLEYRAMMLSYTCTEQQHLCGIPPDIHDTRQLKGTQGGAPEEPSSHLWYFLDVKMPQHESGVNQRDQLLTASTCSAASMKECWKNNVDGLSICPSATLLPLPALQMYDSEAGDVDDSPILSQQVL